MDQYSQHNLKRAASEPQHAVRKAEFDSVTESLRSDLQAHGHADLAPKASPTLTGTPKAPTASAGTSTTQLATTAFVQSAVGGKADTGHTHVTTEIVGLDTALATKAPLASPALTGNPTAPTQSAGNNSTRIATTAFVTTAVAGKADTSHTHTTAQVTGLETALAAKAPLASPALTGTPTAPTAASTVNNTQIATTAFVQTVAATKAATSHTHTTAQVTGLDTALAAKAPLASPSLTGIPVAPTATAGTNTTQLATTAFVTAAVAAKANTSHTHTLSQITDAATKANLASPAFTGTPTAPTAASTVNSTQIATTAFVQTVAATKAAANHTHTTAQVSGLDTTLAGKAPLASPTLTGTPTAPTAASTTNNTQIATTAFVKSLLTSSNLQFKLMTFSRLNSTYVSIGVTPKMILATFYSSFTSGENEYKTGYVYFYVNGSTAYLQTDQCSSIYNPGAIQVSGTTVRSTGWWENVTLLIFY